MSRMDQDRHFRANVAGRLNDRFWPVAACRYQQSAWLGMTACRRKRSFKDGLIEQMNSFDECRLSPRSSRSALQEFTVTTGSNRLKADIHSPADYTRAFV